MKIIEELLGKNDLIVHIIKNEINTDDHYISIRKKSEDEIFEEKLKLIDHLSTRDIHYLYSKKALMRSYAEIDERIKDLYNKLYTDKPNEYTYNLTPDEKEYLDEMLERYRIFNS